MSILCLSLGPYYEAILAALCGDWDSYEPFDA